LGHCTGDITPIRVGGYADTELRAYHFGHLRRYLGAEKWNAKQEQHPWEVIEIKGTNKEHWFERMLGKLRSEPHGLPALPSREGRARSLQELAGPYEQRRAAAGAKLRSSRIARLEIAARS